MCPALCACLLLLPWGCSPRQVFHAALERHGPRRARTFLRRLAWRDLAYWALWRFPWMPEQPLRCGRQAGWRAGWLHLQAGLRWPTPCFNCRAVSQ